MSQFTSLSFPSVRRFLLLGGGETCARLADDCRQKQIGARVTTSPRHASEPIDGVDFSQWLTVRGIPVSIRERLDSSFMRDEATADTLLMSFGAAWILNRELLEAFEGRVVNVHASPLPLHRGAGGYSWRILNQDRRGGLCVHLVDEGLDTGPLLATQLFDYPTSCRTPADFRAHTMGRHLPFLAGFVEEVLKGVSFPVTYQDEEHSTYFPRLSTDRQGWIDWGWPVEDVRSFIEAFDRPYGGASTMMGERRVRLRTCTLADDGPMHPFMAGLVYRRSEAAIWVAANGGGLRLRDVHDETGESQLETIRLGDRLHTPVENLDAARRLRPVYTPLGLR